MLGGHVACKFLVIGGFVHKLVLIRYVFIMGYYEVKEVGG